MLIENCKLHYNNSFTLAYPGDCRLLGIHPDGMLFVEEIYGEDDWLAQHCFRLDGTLVTSVDEDGGVRSIQPLRLPSNLIKSASTQPEVALNFSAGRQRGLRAEERVQDWARPLTITEKMALVNYLKLDILPPMILGLAESYVLTAAPLQPGLDVVCRRMRVAYSLITARRDEQGMAYDYDTLPLYLIHCYDGDDELGLIEALAGLPGCRLHRPMDCLVYGGWLIVADGGAGDRRSAVHRWSIVADQPGA